MPVLYPLFGHSAVAGSFSGALSEGTLLPVGAHPVQLTFTPADPSVYASAAISATINVVPVTTTTQLTATADTDYLDLAVTVVPQFSGIASGVISWSAGNVALGTTPLVNGQASARFAADQRHDCGPVLRRQ